MKTAILTGASSGLGIQFARQLKRVFPEVEELWLIARRQDRLEALAAELTDLKTVVLPLDLCREESFTALREKLAAEQPEVVLLLNNAGCGYLGNVGDGPLARQTTMIDLNVRALTAITHLVLPYMKAGAPNLTPSSIPTAPPRPMSPASPGVSAMSSGTGASAPRRSAPAPWPRSSLPWAASPATRRSLSACPTAIPSRWPSAP